jgi:hypothetical protein
MWLMYMAPVRGACQCLERLCSCGIRALLGVSACVCGHH